jgi:hypothetical protein
MVKNKTQISEAESYKEIGEFWDEHDLGDFWDTLQPVEFEVEIESNTTYFPVETNLSINLVKIAKQHGVSPETLLNLWIQEKMTQELAIKE